MSRRKNQTVKLFRDSNYIDQAALCDLGEVFAYDRDIAGMIADLQAVAGGPPYDLCKNDIQRQRMLEEHQRGKAELGTRLTGLFVEAISTGKLDRVKRLVAAAEMASRGPVSPKYFWLWAYLGIHAMHPDKIYKTLPPWRANVTFSELQREYDVQFDPIEPSQLRQMVKTLGWTLAPDRPGPKVRDNSH